MTVEEAERLVDELRFDKEGVECPSCHRIAKVYNRGINSTMARALISLYKRSAYSYVHAPSLPGDTHEISHFAYWKLIREKKNRRADGGRAGYWQLTSKGRSFVRGELAISQYAQTYDGELIGFAGEELTIDEFLSKRFNYQELMNQ